MPINTICLIGEPFENDVYDWLSCELNQTAGARVEASLNQVQIPRFGVSSPRMCEFQVASAS